jgi:UDPglucose 6-dehydrogenase
LKIGVIGAGYVGLVSAARFAELGHEVITVDNVSEKSNELSGLSNITFAKSAYEASEGSDALLILTEWQEFKMMDLKVIREALRVPMIIDGRNLFVAEEVEAAGLVYYSMGRQVAEDQPAGRVTARAQVA